MQNPTPRFLGGSRSEVVVEFFSQSPVKQHLKNVGGESLDEFIYKLN